MTSSKEYCDSCTSYWAAEGEEPPCNGCIYAVTGCKKKEGVKMVEPTDEEIDHVCSGCQYSVWIGKGILEGPCYNGEECPCGALIELEKAVEEYHNTKKSN